MFEDLASDTVQKVVLLFWLMLVAIVIVGALWTRFNKK